MYYYLFFLIFFLIVLLHRSETRRYVGTFFLLKFLVFSFQFVSRHILKFVAYLIFKLMSYGIGIRVKYDQVPFVIMQYGKI